MKQNIEDKIPKNTPYCYEEERDDKTNEYKKYRACPYWAVKMSDYGQGGRKEMREYCKYLRKYLSVGDQVKDCGISYGDEDGEI